MASETVVIQQYGWPKGLDKDTPEAILEPDWATELLNVEVGDKGALTRRTGYGNTDVDTGNTVANRLDHLYARRIRADDPMTFAVADSTLDGSLFFGQPVTNTYTDTAHDMGQWSDADTGTDYHVPSVVANDRVYFTCLRRTNQDGPVYMAFGGLIDVAIAATDFDGTAARFPYAAALEYIHERVWAGNVQNAANTSAWPSRLHYSNAGDPETWGAADFIDVDPGGDEFITCLKAFGEVLVIFKEHSLFVLGGRSELSFNLFEIDSSLGTTAPKSVQSVGNQLIFFDESRGVFGFDGAGFTHLSAPINDYILNGYNQARSFMANAWVRDNKYYLSLPWGSDTYCSRTFVFNLSNGAWAEWDVGFNGVAEYIGTRTYHCGNPDNTVGVFSLFYTADLATTGDDNGTDITARLETAWLRPGGAPWSRRWAFRNIMVLGDLSGNFTHNVYVATDFASYSGSISISHKDLTRTASDTIKALGHGLKVKVENASGNSFSVAGIEIEATPRGGRSPEALS